MIGKFANVNLNFFFLFQPKELDLDPIMCVPINFKSPLFFFYFFFFFSDNGIPR